MKYKVLDSFKAQTLKGEMEIEPGQVITLPHDKAVRLLNEGKITPIEKVAYKVYSEVLQAHLWVVKTDQDMYSLRSQGMKEAVYTVNELRKLRDLSKDSLKEIHKVKEVFEDSKVEEVIKNETVQKRLS